MTHRTTLAMLLALAAAALSAPATAQEGLEVPEIAAADVTTGQVVSFVNAMIVVENLRREFIPRLEAAEDDAARRVLFDEADAQAFAAVDKVVGITPGEYLAISKVAQNDEGLAERINLRLAEVLQKQSGGRIRVQPAPGAATSE